MKKFFGKSKEEKAHSHPPSGTSTPTPPPPPQPQQPSQTSAYSSYRSDSGGYGGYGSPNSGGNEGYGGGYGRQQDEDSNRAGLFGNRQPANQPPAGYGSGGGYGGYGGRSGGYAPSTTSVDSNREALFGNRQQQQQLQGQAALEQDHASSTPGGYGSHSAGAGTYGEQRQKTAEEEEEEDVDAIKQQIRFTKQESVNSTRRALQAAAQAEETGRSTLTRLGAQGEMLHNTKKNLDLAHNQTRKTEETTRELKTLNGSMFSVHVKNPFNSSKRAANEDERILREHQEQMEERDRTRAAAYDSKARVNNALSGRGGYGSSGRGGYGSSGLSSAERSRYQFEADESDDEKEKEIDHNLDQLGAITGRLKNLAKATSEEVDRQNTLIDTITKKTDQTELGIAKNTRGLKKIH